MTLGSREVYPALNFRDHSVQHTKVKVSSVYVICGNTCTFVMNYFLARLAILSLADKERDPMLLFD